MTDSELVEVVWVFTSDSPRVKRACLLGGTTTTGAGALALFLALERLLDDFDIVTVHFNLQCKSYQNSFLFSITHSKTQRKIKFGPNKFFCKVLNV